MDEEFESFVVTDPDLVDEGIDVSGLRTQTDVNPFLLGSVAPGIKYEGIGYSPTAIQDLVRYFQFVEDPLHGIHHQHILFHQ